MVFLPSILPRAQLQHQVLSPRDTEGGDDADQDNWSTMQITAPIIVGVALIIIFAAYIIWHRWSHRFKHHYRQVRDACVSRFSQAFTPRHRRRLQHTSIPVTLDDSMVTPRHIRRYHSYVRSDSTDSQTPLADSDVEFSYPPKNPADFSGKPVPEESQWPGRRPWRWQRLFGMGPREVKPKVPNHRWVVEGPDESSVGHGDPSLSSPSVAARPRWTSSLAPVDERTRDDESDPSRGFYGGVMEIGERFSAHSAPMSSAFHEVFTAPAMFPGSVPTSARTAAPEYSAVEDPYSTSNSRTMTTAPTTFIPQSSYYTPGATISNSPAPPMYSSISHSRNASMESIIYPARADPTVLYPGSVRAVGRSLPHVYHERQMSTESMLATSAPMITQGIY
ncbi:hypothetical protein DFH29DRAFT_898247 [Suillus ampliporus]|nr:hypothetical protein DFH29DRAFT_898247 [Suillus ampliporus]